MCTLHHTPHKPSSPITHPTLPHNVEHSVKRAMPRALLQPLMPQMLRKEPSATLPRAEPRKRAAPYIREETRVDCASCTRAVYSTVLHTNRLGSRGISGLALAVAIMR